MNTLLKKFRLLFPSILLFMLFILVFTVFDLPHKKEVIVEKKTPERKQKDIIVRQPLVHAESFVVVDLVTKKTLFGQNEHTALPLASLTKLMTTLAASHIFARTTIINPASVFVSTEPFLNVLWDFKHLAQYTLTVSSNTGAAAIAGIAGSTLSKSGEGFVQKMNAIAESIGLSETYFINASGLDDSEALNGGYGSASDMARLLVAAQKEIPDILSVTAIPESDFQSESGEWFHAINTNQAIRDIPGLIAGKTGFTNLAGGNLAILFDADIGHPIAIVVLGSSKEGRFDDIAALVQATLQKIHNR